MLDEKYFNGIGDTSQMDEETWLSIRRNYIGGSDAGAVAGLNPYRSALNVYMEKTAIREEEEDANPKRERKLWYGRRAEALVAELFEKETGKHVLNNTNMMVSREHPFMLADIDREIEGENAILECKTASTYAKASWEDGGVPVSYELQCHHYMAVTGADRVYIACLMGAGDEFYIRTIERDEDTIALLVDVEKEFYECLQNHVMPPVDGSSAYSDALKERYPEEEPGEVVAIDPHEVNVKRYFELKEQEKILHEEAEKVIQAIQQKMGTAERATIGNYEARWKSVTSHRVDTKALKKEKPEIAKAYEKESISRRFTIKEQEREDMER